MLFVFNTTICTTIGLTYHTRIVTPEWARRFIRDREVISAIGHESTAQIASIVLGRDVPVNRIAASMQAGDEAICIKLRGRPQEGVILSAEEVEAIGYDLVLMSAVDQSAVTEDCFARTEHDPDSLR